MASPNTSNNIGLHFININLLNTYPLQHAQPWSLPEAQGSICIDKSNISYLYNNNGILQQPSSMYVSWTLEMINKQVTCLIHYQTHYNIGWGGLPCIIFECRCVPEFNKATSKQRKRSERSSRWEVKAHIVPNGGFRNSISYWVPCCKWGISLSVLKWYVLFCLRELVSLSVFRKY